jgi:hypothetical protein
MPDLPSPYLAALLGNSDPNTSSDYFNAQRQQMLAQMLMQNQQQSNQTPADWNQMRLVPRRSPLSALSTLASGLLAGKALKGSQTAQQKYFQDLSTPQQQPQDGTSQPSAQMPPGLPPGMTQQRAQMMMASGDKGMQELGKTYLDQIMKFNPPPSLQGDFNTAGFSQPQRAAAATDAITKANNIPPVEIRKENLAVEGAAPHKPIGYNPAVPEGTFPSFDASGMPTKVNEIPGATAAQTGTAAAKTAGTESQTPKPIGTDANGKMLYGFPIPPALNQPQVPAPTAPQSPVAPSVSSKYFPPSTATAGGGMPASPATIQGQKSGAEQGQVYAGELSKNANGATEVRRSLAEMKNLASQATPNAMNESKMRFGAMMIASGVSPQTAAGYLGVDVGALQAAAKQTSTLAVNSIHSMTSRGTNFDLSTFMRNNPNLNMADPAAFNRVVDYMDNKAKQEIAKQKDFATWKQGVSPDEWETGHTAHWLEKQNQDIEAGKSNSSNPSAVKYYNSKSELQAAAARGEVKVKDRVKIGNQTGTWK